MAGGRGEGVAFQWVLIAVTMCKVSLCRGWNNRGDGNIQQIKGNSENNIYYLRVAKMGAVLISNLQCVISNVKKFFYCTFEYNGHSEELCTKVSYYEMFCPIF